MGDRGLLPIGEVASRAGLRPSALRYYEEVGLVSPAARIGGRRYYDPSVFDRLGLIALCQDTAFTVAEIAEILGGNGGRGRWRELTERKLAEVQAQIEKAKATKRLIEEALRCNCGSLEGCQLVQGARARRVSRHTHSRETGSTNRIVAPMQARS